MRLLTLNTHSLTGPEAEQNLQRFVDGVAALQPDVIALQEVNQRRNAPPVEGCPALRREIPVRRDNFALRAVQLLRETGFAYHWTWLPVKIGYGRFDEGLALLTRQRIADVAHCLISRSGDYASWKTRAALAVRTEGMPDWFCCVHMGWWNDTEEPFSAQWEALTAFIGQWRPSPVWLMGDFNAPAEVRGESYDRIAASGWHDCWLLAENPATGATIPGRIDGWHGQDATPQGLRIDHIWCKPACAIRSASVVFDGRRQALVSDHYGVLAETSKLETEESP